MPASSTQKRCCLSDRLSNAAQSTSDITTDTSFKNALKYFTPCGHIQVGQLTTEQRKTPQLELTEKNNSYFSSLNTHKILETKMPPEQEVLPCRLSVAEQQGSQRLHHTLAHQQERKTRKAHCDMHRRALLTSVAVLHLPETHSLLSLPL